MDNRSRPDVLLFIQQVSVERVLVDRMNTPTAQRIAKSRHLYTKEFVQRFKAQWEAEDVHGASEVEGT